MKIDFKPVFVWLKTRLKLPKLKLKKPHISDDFKRETGLILFFCLFYVGIAGFDWRIANIICGLMGIWYFFPRKG
jgi:hypothetical protein